MLLALIRPLNLLEGYNSASRNMNHSYSNLESMAAYRFTPLQLFAKQQLKYKCKAWFIESILNAKWRFITELDPYFLILFVPANKVILIQYDFMSVKIFLVK